MTRAGTGAICALAALTAGRASAATGRLSGTEVAPAPAATVEFAGSCAFSGPITPEPPITLVPRRGAHFSYAGTGTCSGQFGGTAVSALPITLTFTHVATAFDTCELGPDLNLHGTLAARGAGMTIDFPVTINLLRLALFGPFTLTTRGGGAAAGTALFTPANPAAAILQCISGGIATATLSGTFSTSSPLLGNRHRRLGRRGSRKDAPR